MQGRLEEFEQYLKELKLMNEKHQPYMLWWVRHYLFLHRPDDPEYSQILQEEGKEDWQIGQALDAVKLYHQFSGEVPSPQIDGLMENPVEDLVDKLQVRHYSCSTVKYIRTGAHVILTSAL